MRVADGWVRLGLRFWVSGLLVVDGGIGWMRRGRSIRWFWLLSELGFWGFGVRPTLKIQIIVVRRIAV